MDIDNTTLRWYIIHTYATYETKVKQSLENIIEQNNLEEFIVDIRIPMVQEVQEKDGKRKIKEVKKYPSYVFVKAKLTEQIRYFITSTKGVTGFVGPGGDPKALTDDETIRMGLEKLDVEEFAIKEGDEIEIVSGVLTTLTGIVQNVLLDKEKVKVVITVAGRNSIVELGFNQVKKVEPLN
ncbi:MAG TPA: transcription termination/antitermination NusG family protein [Clostridia bacterium]|jgi:transcriptional antiterminator NusG|nr:transcription termination/antitermination NusG family protein [Clostridia bacterium]